jgi:hypothetical protein
MDLSEPEEVERLFGALRGTHIGRKAILDTTSKLLDEVAGNHATLCTALQIDRKSTILFFVTCVQQMIVQAREVEPEAVAQAINLVEADYMMRKEGSDGV